MSLLQKFKRQEPRVKDEKPPSLKKRFARLMSKDGMTKGDRERQRLAKEQEQAVHEEAVEKKPEPKTPEPAPTEEVAGTMSTSAITPEETQDIEEENLSPSKLSFAASPRV
eukprot:scaffold203_cov386-Prasinococcus_capsulatus_cf.AAC.20